MTKSQHTPGLQKRHPFSYTLGEGPYKYVGSFDLGRVIGAMNNGNIAAYNNGLTELQNWKLERGAGTCSHCGHAILNIQIVQRGDGKLFGVGSDCILKVAADGDVGEVSKLERQIRADNKRKRQERESNKVSELESDFQAALVKLESQPHPNEYFAKQGKTMRDYYEYFAKNSKNMRNAIAKARGEK